MQLTKDFTLEMLIKSDVAARHGLDNTPGPEAVSRLKITAINLCQPLKDRFGGYYVTSGYRSIAINNIVGGQPTSQHCLGEAVDQEAIGLSNYELAIWIKEHLDFDQLILEGYKKGVAESGWVHASYRSPQENRGQLFTAFHNPKGGMIYEKGLVF